MLRTLLALVLVALVHPVATRAETRPDASPSPRPMPKARLARRAAPFTFDGVSAPSAEAMRRVAPYLSRRQARVCDWSADGKSLFVSADYAGRPEAYRLDAPRAVPRRASWLARSVTELRAGRDAGPSYLLLASSAGGRSHLARLDIDTRNVTSMTAERGLLPGLAVSADGKTLAFASIHGRETRIWTGSPRDPASIRACATCTGAVHVESFSPDGTRLALIQLRPAGGTLVSEVNLPAGRLEPVTPEVAGDPTTYTHVRYAPDGRSLWAVADGNREHRRLVRLDAAGHETPAAAEAPGDVVAFETAPAGPAAALIASADGVDRLYLVDPATGVAKAVAGVPQGTLSNLRFDPAGKRLAFDVSNFEMSEDVFVLDLADGTVTRWTANETGAPEAGAWPAPKLERVGTDDQVDGKPRLLTVHHYPAGGTRTGRAPVVVVLPESPASGWRASYHPMVAALTRELGVAVLAPVLRGSAGQGRTFRSLDDGPKRADVLSDLSALLDWIKDRPDLDSSRVAVLGYSYGGWLALAGLARFPGRLCAGVSVCGIVDLARWAGTARGPELARARAEFGDERDPKVRAFLDELSPLKRAGAIAAPVLFIHGNLDARAQLEDVYAVKRALDARNIEAGVCGLRLEGHGLRDRRSTAMATALAFAFLGRHLGVRSGK